MNELTKKKKKGFTLIELIAVIAIIGILAAVLVPKVVGYMDDAKKSKVIAQCRTIVMAYETINAKDTASTLTTASSVADVFTKASGYEDYVDLDGIDMIPATSSTIKIANCKEVVNGQVSPKIEGGKWSGATEAK